MEEPQEEPPSVSPSYNPAPVAAKTFTIDELERATDGFAPHNFVGEGGFGRVYRGVLESTGEVGKGMKNILLIFCFHQYASYITGCCSETIR